jgi:hypothetical protein
MLPAEGGESMKRVAIAALCVTAVAAAACVQTSAIRLAGSQPLPQTNPDDVEVYLSARDVPVPYTRLALIHAEEMWGAPSFGEMVARMKAKAAKMGANGLILESMARGVDISDGDEIPVSFDTGKLARGVAIYITR